MATWEDIARFIRAEYKITSDDGGLLALVFDIGGGRSQLLHVSQGMAPSSSDEFAEIASPIGTVASADLPDLLKDASKLVVGGIVQYGDTLVLRHTVPLAHVDTSEFVASLENILQSADMLEMKYTGADKH